jgi:F0F1-type ATP synthase assembly protein I
MILVMPNTDSQRDRSGGNYARFFHVGFAFMLIIAVFTGGGYLLDWLVGTLPLFLLLGMLVGFGASLYYLFQALKQVGGG